MRYHHLLDYLEGKERADDQPFGGGPGMVLRIEPLSRVLDALIAAAPADERRAIVVPSPSGKPFVQSDAQRFAQLDRLIVICGHYEGIDERLAEVYPIEEYSLGDFVLTGGEIPALAFMDATVRLLEAPCAPNRSLPNRLTRVNSTTQVINAAADVSRRERSRRPALRRPCEDCALATRTMGAHRRAPQRPTGRITLAATLFTRDRRA